MFKLLHFEVFKYLFMHDSVYYVQSKFTFNAYTRGSDSVNNAVTRLDNR